MAKKNEQGDINVAEIQARVARLQTESKAAMAKINDIFRKGIEADTLKGKRDQATAALNALRKASKAGRQSSKILEAYQTLVNPDGVDSETDSEDSDS